MVWCGEGVPKATKIWMSGPEPQGKKARFPKEAKACASSTKKTRIKKVREVHGVTGRNREKAWDRWACGS